jgi:hypothetical protein
VIEHILTKSSQVPGMKPTICQDYLEFLNGHPTNSSRMAAQFTEAEIPYMQELLKHHMPVPAYEAVDAPLIRQQPLLERLVTSTNRLGRTEQPGRVEYYQLFFNQDDIRSETIEAIAGRIGACTRVAKCRYHFENWGKDLGTYCLTLHVNRE